SVVRHQVASLIGLYVQYAAHCARCGARNVESANVPAALDQRDDDVLVLVAATRDALAPLARLLTPKRFVGFQRLALPTNRTRRALGHGFADAVRHEPCCLVGDAEHTVQL